MDSVKPKRGLSALLASTTQAPPTSTSAMAASAPAPVISNTVSSADIPLSAIRPSPTQPRTYFDPEALKEGDAEMLQDLVVAAVNEANRKIDEAMKGKLGGMLPPGLGGLFG